MTAEWVAALTALVAVVVGPFVGVYVARRQIQISAISTNRSEWIRQLRELVAQLITECRCFGIEFIAGEDGIEKSKTYEKIERIFYLEQQIVLMLNPDEPEHEELARLIRNAVSNTGNFDKDRRKKLSDHVQLVSGAAQKILKSEWEVLKAGR